MAIEFSARLPPRCELRPGFPRSSRWASPQDSSITCWIEASIECQIRGYGLQRLACLPRMLEGAAIESRKNKDGRDRLRGKPGTRLRQFGRRKEPNRRATDSGASKGERLHLPPRIRHDSDP